MPFFKVRAPALPNASASYEASAQNAFADVLRLYFNRLDGDLTALGDSLGGAQLNIPTALYYDTTQQTAATINTAYKLKFGNTYFQNGIAVSGTGGTTFTVTKPGIYNFQFSGQMWSTSASSKEIQVWIRKNGTDVGYSGHAYTIHDNTSHQVAQWNFNIDLGANEYIEMMWATDDIDFYFDPEAASSPYPGIPSTVIAINLISNTEGFTIATTP